jgi:hypothetical protein
MSEPASARIAGWKAVLRRSGFLKIPNPAKPEPKTLSGNPNLEFDFPPQRGGLRSLSVKGGVRRDEIQSSFRAVIRSPTNS